MPRTVSGRSPGPAEASRPARAAAAALVACLAVLAPPGPALAEASDPSPLPPPVREALVAHRLPAAGLSIWVQPVDAAEPTLAFNAEVPRNPASVMKLVTTLVGLHELGPNFRWRTRAYATGRRVGGDLEGDLLIRGEGDPYLVTESFWKFLRGVRERGIERVRGDLIVDTSYFDVPAQDPAAFDGEPYRTYNARPSALLVNFNATRFTFVPDRDAERVDIVLDPPSPLRIDNRIEYALGRCEGARNRLRMQVLGTAFDPEVRFSGRYPVGCGTYTLRRSVGDPSSHARGVLRSLWSELGGTIEGADREGAIPDTARVVLTWRSRPLSEAVRGMNKFSNNVMARQLLLTLGAEAGQPPGTVEKGRAAIRGWLERQAIGVEGMVVDNGAGLSRDARISARTLGEILERAWRSPLMPEFVSSLPLSAVDGTLGRRFRSAPFAGRAHMKTGLLDDVRAIGGYLVGRSGRVMAVVVLHNHPGIHNGPGTRVQDAVLDWVYDNA